MKRVPLRKRGCGEVAKLEHIADTLTQRVACRDARCIRCGSVYGLSAHHLIPRSRCHGKLCSLRYDPRNIVVLCYAKCHIPFAHGKPVEFWEWMKLYDPRRMEWLASQDSGESTTTSSTRTEENLKEIIETLRGCVGQS